MNYTDFKTQLLNGVIDALEEQTASSIADFELRYHTMSIPTGTSERLIVSKPGTNLSMALRIEEMYESLENGSESIDELIHNAVQIILDNYTTLDDADKTDKIKKIVTDYSEAKKISRLRLCPGGSPNLADIPHRDIADMALVVSLRLPQIQNNPGGGISTTVVTKELLNIYGITEDELFEDAAINSQRDDPSHIIHLLDAIPPSMRPADTPANQPYLITTASQFYGAAVIAYPDFNDKIKQTINENVFVLPSSVNELILVPESHVKPEDVIGLNDAIAGGNAMLQSQREYLGDHFYYYDINSKTLITDDEYFNSHP